MERLGEWQRIDRIAAVLVSVSFNVALLWLLNASLRPLGPLEDPAETVLQLVWIEEPPVAPLPSTAEAFARQPNRRAREIEVAVPVLDKTVPAVETGPRKGAPALDLSLPDGEVGFPSRRIYVPGPSQALAPEPRARFAFVDRSFGGTMQRMSKNRMCGELKFALTDSPESTDAILASMKRIGCGERQ